MSTRATQAMSPREEQVLDALADRLSNGEIAARLYISVRTVESHVSALLRKLDAPDRRALAEIGLRHRRDRTDELGDLHDALRFIGRGDELEELARLVEVERLVTITGSGGVGKTRLLFEFARRAARRFPDGVIAIELAPVRDPALVVTTAAAAAGVRTDSGVDLITAISSYMAPRRALVLLDNCEHVADAAAALAHALVSGDGQVVVLATSREALRLRAERVMTLAPLPVPEPGSSADSTDGSASVELFVDRAVMADTSFLVTSDNRWVVREICAAVDGLPLALELAAARLAELPLATLARSLNGSLNVLERGGRDTPERHRTIRETVNWSYQLLDADQRKVFERLSVFAGTFSVEAAEVVAGFDAIDLRTVPAHLASLVAKSLVVRQESGYRLLEPVRQFAAERLADTAEATVVSERHLEQVVAATEAFGLGYTTAGTPEQLDAMRADDANIRAALVHAFGPSSRDATLGIRLAAASAWRWFLDGMLDEATDWTARAITASQGTDDYLRFIARYASGAIAVCRSDLTTTARLATEMEELALALARDDFLAFANDLRGNARWGLGDLDAAESDIANAIELSRRSGVYWHEAFAFAELARVVGDRGDKTRAGELADRALEASAAVGEHMPIGFALDVRANQHFADGNVDDAEAVGTQSLAHYSQIGYREGIASATHLLARIALARGDLATCHERNRDTLELHRQLGNRGGIAAALETKSMLLAAERAHHDAAVVLGASDELRRQLGIAAASNDRPAIDELRRRLYAELGGELSGALHRGVVLGVNAAIDLVV